MTINEDDFREIFDEHLNHFGTFELNHLKDWLDGIVYLGHQFKANCFNRAFLELFYIKIFGLLSECEEFAKFIFLNVEQVDLVNREFPEKQFPIEYRVECTDFWSSVDEISRNLTEHKEVLDYLRNRSSHLVTNKFLRINTKTFKFSPKRNDLVPPLDKKDIRDNILTQIDALGGVEKLALEIYNKNEVHIRSMLNSVNSNLKRHQI